MSKSYLILFALLTPHSLFCADQPLVHVQPSNTQGPRALQDQTAQAVVRDYLQSWRCLNTALEQNRIDALDADFVGTAKDKIAATIQEQSQLGIETRYQDRAHDLKIAFYSPEGLSIELQDTVDYDVQVIDHGKSGTPQRVHARYIVVLTPAEVRWKVRVFQADVN